MTDQEKWFCLQAILTGIRGDWGSRLGVRVKGARKLAEELEYQPTINLINEFEYDDGRHFRTSVEFGGYEGMDEMHKLPWTLLDKSQEVQDYVRAFTNYASFEDSEHDPNVGEFGEWK